MDLTKLSDSDLLALKSGDLSKLSDEGLMALKSGVSAAPKDESSTIANLVSGGIKGASNIGATILQPVDWAARKMGVKNAVVGYEPGERRRMITEGLQSAGEAIGAPINPESLAFKGGELAAELAGTAAVPGVVAKPFMAAGRAVPAAARVGQAIESAGFAGADTGSRLANALLRVGGGATAGGASAALVNPEDAAAGAAGGGLFGAVSKPIGRGIEKVAMRFAPKASGIADMADDAVYQVSQELGGTKAIPAETVDWIKQEATKAAKAGKLIDPKALARQVEFEQLGMKPLLGQVTRDPAQFAQERNLRGASPEIAARLQEQNRTLQDIFGRPAAAAQEPYAAGRVLVDELAKQEAKMAENVSSLYKQARASAGKDLELPLGGLANDYMTVLDQFGDKVPSGVRNQFKKFGLEGSNQTKLYTVEEADKILKVINANVGSDPATNNALGQLRNAVKNSITSVDDTGGVFAPAMKAARERFSTLESMPAMAAASEGTAVPEKFVQKYITQAPTDNVKTLAASLRQNPQAFNQAKLQIADDIRRAAFGENITADAAISPERLSKKLRELGTEKMGAFFTPDEINRYQTALKVASYIEKHPNAAPVNTSNTLVAALMQSPITAGLGKMASKIPGAETATSIAKAVVEPVQKGMAVSRAVKAELPTTKIELPEAQRKLLVKVLGSAGAAAGVLSQ